MKQFQFALAWLLTFLVVFSSIAADGCNTKQSMTAAPSVQQPAANAAPQDTNATPAIQQVSAQQGDQSQQQQQIQFPEVNLTPAGLDELLAPVALYPDPVLAVMMQAAVNPQEVMDGGNWLALDQNQGLKDAALDQASQKAGFTPVMQALLHYPTVVDMMCTQFDWTKQLGAAYQSNPKAVLDSVQRLRAQAVDTGALKSSAQMTVETTQSNGQQVIECKPADPKVVYIPQYNPDQVYQTTTTTTRPDGTTTTTTTTSGPAPATSTTVVQQQSSGVSTGTAVAIGLLSFGAGIALGAAINNNNYYYPAWGYGGVWYGPRPYYPPPYRPVYYGGWHGGYNYNRPVHYGNTNIYVNNNYYNRFNNNSNLRPGYQPRPVPYNHNPNSTYSRNMGGRPGANQGVQYRPPANNANLGARPASPNIQNRPGTGNVGTTPTQHPVPGNNANNWKGQTTYQGNKNLEANRANPSTMPGRNPSGDRGFAQNGGVRPNTGDTSYNRPNAGNASNNRPNADNSPNARPAATRPATPTQPAARPTPTPANQPSARPATQRQDRPQQQSGGAFSGASNARADRDASSRGHASMGASAGHQAAGGARKR
jgi:Protein of unknown function (DUF3300)